VHRYDFRIVDGVPMLIASAISPIYKNNPAFFRLDVDENGVVRDIVPFVYDPYADQWERMPSFNTMYDVKSFTRVPLETIAARIRSDLNTRETWMRAYVAWSRRAASIARNWMPFACAQTEISGGFASCAGTTNQSRKVVVVAIGMLVLLVLLGWWVFRWRKSATTAQ
jgi:hypothetical protein